MKAAIFISALTMTVLWHATAAEPWTVDRAIRYAQTNSPSARIARYRITAAEAALSQAKAAFSPRLQLQSSYTRTDNPMLVFGSILNQRAYPAAGVDFNHVPDIDDANVKGLLTMPLYAGGRNVANRDAARANAEATRYDEAAVQNELAFQVARAFHTVLKTSEFIKATEAGVRAFETNALLATQRFNAGTLLKADVLDVEVRLAQAREDLVRARNAHALALRGFRNLLGLGDEGITLAETTASGVSIDDAGDYSARPELVASARRQQAAEANLRRASGGYKPRLSAFGSLDYDYGTRTESDGGSYTAGVLLQWDLWDGQLTRSKRAEARANLETAREQDRQLRLALDLEFEQAQLALREASERLQVTAKVIEQAEESVELTRSRFQQGLAVHTQLIDAETALIGARVRRAEAEADRRIAQAALLKAQGRTLLSTSR